MTNLQLSLAIGIPILFNTGVTLSVMLDARLKHLEETRRP